LLNLWTRESDTNVIRTTSPQKLDGGNSRDGKGEDNKFSKKAIDPPTCNLLRYEEQELISKRKVSTGNAGSRSPLHRLHWVPMARLGGKRAVGIEGEIRKNYHNTPNTDTSGREGGNSLIESRSRGL